MDYEYRAQMIIIQGGYDGEDKGVNPEDTNWNPGTPGQPYGPLTYSYYYTDSNSGTNSQSSRITIKATDSWTGEFDGDNNLIITITTKINSIVRGNIQGNPLAGGNWTRDITISREKGGKVYFSVNGDGIGYGHTLSGPIDLGTETITIPPGGETVRGSLYVLNHTTGLAWTEAYTDEMWCGITFRNPREAEPDTPTWTEFDYRPGANYDGSAWMSHNRNNGAANVSNGSNWIEMRTHYNGAEFVLQSEDAPFNRHPDGWKNMYNIGQDHWPSGNPYLNN